MKRIFPLMAVMAATLAAPVAAQDISSILNPGNFAARLGTNGNAAFANLPRGTIMAPTMSGDLRAAITGQVASLQPRASSLAPRVSLLPIRRGETARIVLPSADTAPVVAHVAPAAAAPRGSDLGAMMAAAAETAPAGANTLVVNGSNTAVISSSPSTQSPGFWRRLFGG